MINWTVYITDSTQIVDNKYIIESPRNWLFQPKTQFDIAISSAFIRTDTNISSHILNIETSGVSNNICPNINKRLLAIVGKREKGIYSHTSNDLVFQPLLIDSPNSISISIVDSITNQTIQVSNAVITFSLRKNSTMNNHHLNIRGQIRFNDESGETECDISLPHHVQLKRVGNWQMALSSISYPNPNEWNGPMDTMTIQYKNEHFRHRCPLTKHDNAQAIVRRLQNVVREKTGLNHNHLRFSIKNGKLKMISTHAIRITFTPRMGYLLGNCKYGPEKANTAIILPRREEVSLDSPINFSRRKSDIIQIKSPMISASAVNSNFGCILKTIPIPATSKHYITYQSVNLEYFDIQHMNLNHIKFIFQNESGRKMDIKNGENVFICISLKHNPLQ